MSNDYYTASGDPVTSSDAESEKIRNELSAVEEGFDKQPTLTGSGDKPVFVNTSGTALEAITAASALTKLGAVSDADLTAQTIAEHADTTATGAQLNTLVGGGDTSLHDHDGIAENTAARHDESHTVASHSDTTATGAELNTLTDGSDVGSLHDHDGISENTAARHAEAHTVASHSDTTATGAELNNLTGGGVTSLHSHELSSITLDSASGSVELLPENVAGAGVLTMPNTTDTVTVYGDIAINPKDYATVQAAFDVGGNIYVSEDHVITSYIRVTKPTYVYGPGSISIVADGSGEGSIFGVEADFSIKGVELNITATVKLGTSFHIYCADDSPSGGDTYSVDVVVENCTLTGAGKDCIYIGSEDSTLTVRNTTCNDYGRWGISATCAKSVLLDNISGFSSVTAIPGSQNLGLIDIEPANGGVVKSAKVQNTVTDELVSLIYVQPSNLSDNISLSNCSLGTLYLSTINANIVSLSECYIDSFYLLDTNHEASPTFLHNCTVDNYIYPDFSATPTDLSIVSVNTKVAENMLPFSLVPSGGFGSWSATGSTGQQSVVDDYLYINSDNLGTYLTGPEIPISTAETTISIGLEACDANTLTSGNVADNKAYVQLQTFNAADANIESFDIKIPVRSDLKQLARVITLTPPTVGDEAATTPTYLIYNLVVGGGYHEIKARKMFLFKGSCTTFAENKTDKLIRDTVEPAVGSHYASEIVYNISPSIGEFTGWVCTVTGTPGTWEGFGKVPYFSATSPSTIGVEVGFIAWNTVPTAGGEIGWVCVTSANPDVWKSFGAISA